MAEFWEHYKRPEWQRKRLEVMEAAGFACQECCAEDKTLNAHHTYYVAGRKPWDYPLEAFRCLCLDCHEFHHNLAGKLKAIIGRMKEPNLVRLFQFARQLDREQDEENRRAAGLPEMEEFAW